LFWEVIHKAKGAESPLVAETWAQFIVRYEVQEMAARLETFGICVVKQLDEETKQWIHRWFLLVG
jgi:hypothetical protein